ncbi:MAG TPA: serine hydrolase domain-containing protein, partial [Rhodothermales bacterium]|nr:serine hydrolase domain-containing protein [Rhodothermales bacterium]
SSSTGEGAGIFVQLDVAPTYKIFGMGGLQLALGGPPPGGAPNTAPAPATPVQTITLSRAELERYTGIYGERTLRVQGSRLFSQRAENPAFPLQPLGNHRFRVAGSPVEFQFIADAAGKIVAMEVHRPGEPVERVARTGDAPPPRRLTRAEAARELRAYLDGLAQQGLISGVVAWAKDGEPVVAQAYGMADREATRPNTLDTRFYIASMNKMFTAVAIGQLVEQGKLSFDDPVSKFIPDFPNAQDAQRIQIKHLLTHTSGLGFYWSPRFDQERPQTVAAMLNIARDNAQLDFAPGTSWGYSNTGFLLLGAIIEKVTGQSYYDYVQRNVYERAGMTATGAAPDGQLPSDLAVPYIEQAGGIFAGVRNNPRGGPAGGGYTTAQDLLRFAEALRHHRLLGPAMTQTLLSPKPELNSEAYGYGFSIEPAGEGTVVGHNGGSEGVLANLDLFLPSGFEAVVLLNQRPDTGPESNQTAQEIVNKVRALTQAVEAAGEGR